MAASSDTESIDTWHVERLASLGIDQGVLESLLLDLTFLSAKGNPK
jgi:hypothetical protein